MHTATLSPLRGFALVSLLLMGLIPTTTGCAPTSAQIQADANAVAAAVQSVASLVVKTNAQVADKLSMAASALVAAVANWNTTSLTNDINTAANVIEVTLAAIPITAPYAGLVGIAVAAIEVLLANLPHNTVQAMALPQGPNPYRGTKIPHRFGRSIQGDLKAAWNAEAVKVPGAVKF